MERPRQDREPPPPTPLDGVLSEATLESSPWVLRRIQSLRLKGRLVRGWTPPMVKVPNLRRQFWSARNA